jgi:hypothetical protein
MLCDTVGIMTPSRMAAHVTAVREALGPGAALGVHCHNDFGMATANTLAAIEAGVDWPTVCVNGIGERSGNASLAEVVLASRLLLERDPGIDPASLPALSEAVERVTGVVVPPHQPIVGRNAYRHESGIHVDGLLKGAETYEPIPPGLVGRRRELVIGRQSGRAHLRFLAWSAGLTLTDAAAERVLARLKTRGPGAARARFAEVRATLTAWESAFLGIPADAVLSLLLEEASSRGTDASDGRGAVSAEQVRDREPPSPVPGHPAESPRISAAPAALSGHPAESPRISAAPHAATPPSPDRRRGEGE